MMSTFDLKHLGVINDPDGLANVKGICGDTMVFYLSIKDGVIYDVRFNTDGCEHARICGETAARLVNGKRIEEALRLSPSLIKNEISELSVDHLHCPILATISFLKAMADYLYKRGF